MVVVEATRLNANEQFEYRIIATGRPSFTTSATQEAVRRLTELGVDRAEALIAHSRSWGLIEIFEPGDSGTEATGCSR